MHTISWFLSSNGIESVIRCVELGAQKLCRLVCPEECEQVVPAQDESGKWVHRAWDHRADIEVEHQLVDTDYCLAVEGLSMSPAAEHAYVGEKTSLRDGLIEPVRNGDCWAWRYAE